jgi:hypothetical protein
LKTFTWNGAYLTFDDEFRGSPETGKLADLVILEADLLSVDPEELLTMRERVLATIVGGRVVYRRADFSI